MQALIDALRAAMSRRDVSRLAFHRWRDRYACRVRQASAGGTWYRVKLTVPPQADMFVAYLFLHRPGRVVQCVRVTTHRNPHEFPMRLGDALVAKAFRERPKYDAMVDVLRVTPEEVRDAWLETNRDDAATVLFYLGPPEVVSRPLLSPKWRALHRQGVERRTLDVVREVMERVRRRKDQQATPAEVERVRAAVSAGGWAVRSIWRGRLPAGCSW